jgi:hypothetical protein
MKNKRSWIAVSAFFLAFLFQNSGALMAQVRYSGGLGQDHRPGVSLPERAVFQFRRHCHARLCNHHRRSLTKTQITVELTKEVLRNTLKGP